MKTIENPKTYRYQGFSEAIEFAESLGWEDTHGDSDSGNWDADDCDACEGEALEFIRANGYRIVGLD